MNWNLDGVKREQKGNCAQNTKRIRYFQRTWREWEHYIILRDFNVRRGTVDPQFQGMYKVTEGKKAEGGELES
jgi:hypothetical protein